MEMPFLYNFSCPVKANSYFKFYKGQISIYIILS